MSASRPITTDDGLQLPRYARIVPAVDHLKVYARAIRAQRRAHAEVSEPALAPKFQQLLEALLPALPAVPALVIVAEFANPGVGRPDIALVRAGQPPRAFIELKAPAKPIEPQRWRDHDRRQFDRFGELAHWALSNFHDFRLYARTDSIGRATIVPEAALDPDRGDAEADRLIDRHDAEPFLTLLAQLARAEAPAARNAQQLAELLAHSARLVRSSVEERLAQIADADPDADPLLLVRRTFRDVLYAHPEAGGYAARDFDVLFSSAFAQTLAFGLLLVREATPPETAVGLDAWELMPAEHPLMRAALRVLSEPEVVREIGVGFAVMCDTVNSFAPEILALRPDGRDPILYFYEDFLQTFDPAARERYGVYYTPIEVVRYMTAALDRVLRDRLGTAGLRDPGVTILDPATGTGTFLLGIAERVRDQVTAAEGGPAAGLALRGLAARMFGFELLVGPYAVAHYRLHHALRNRPADDLEDAPQPVHLPRLGIYLADTLADPAADAPAGALGIQGLPIGEERRAANRIKAEVPILAIVGNPPYKRLEAGENETLVGRWMDGVWDDLKAPVRDAGKGNQLNTFPEFSVAFWRWAIWKLFEADNAPRRGVIAFITNRKFLTGWPYAGLRKMMRERFDRIEIVDLRGDLRAGPRGDVADDEGVFNIMVGTAITICVADGSKADGALAEVTYNDAWGHELFGRRAKLDWLLAGANAETLVGNVVDRAAMEDFRERPFQNGEWVNLADCFAFYGSGVQTKRDEFIYSPSQGDLQLRATNFIRALQQRATEIFHPTSARSSDDAQAVLRDAIDRNQLSTPLRSYRPFDRRYALDYTVCIDRPRPDLRAVWGDANLCLYSLPTGIGMGPAAWSYGLLPDYHAFRGSYGGYAFPLHDRRAGPDATNLNPALVAALGAAYGAAVAPADVFDAILALLSAASYTTRFAEDLEDVFPHVPFPATRAVFDRAVAIGREIRAVETFARAPAERFRPRTFARLVTDITPGAPLGPGGYADGEILLAADGSGRVTGLPQAVWDFAVSGYRVLPRWIEARRGLPADQVWPELRDVAARIHEIIHRFGEADLVLDATLADTLTRDELGFAMPDPEPETADEQA